ncbi:hypothetical protein BDR07DRAFT_1401175 [Suillus spraguei]|nr:hypothetical protein BDR07DRAFT_1401175 [Suillus spraguei]
MPRSEMNSMKYSIMHPLSLDPGEKDLTWKSCPYQKAYQVPSVRHLVRSFKSKTGSRGWPSIWTKKDADDALQLLGPVIVERAFTVQQLDRANTLVNIDIYLCSYYLS